MKVFVVLSVLLAAVSAEFCYNDVQEACSPRPIGISDGTLLANCNAKYGLFNKEAGMLSGLQAYVNAQIEANFEYLLLSSYFGNYQANRAGFERIYRQLSDQSWDDAIDLVKFITKRGGKMNFGEMPRYKNNVSKNVPEGKEKRPVLDLNELNSLAKALDTQKHLAEESLHLHSQAQRHMEEDGSVAHYLEERFMEPQADCVRKLAGHVTDLKQLLSSREEPVSVYLFDEYLQKYV